MSDTSSPRFATPANGHTLGCIGKPPHVHSPPTGEDYAQHVHVPFRPADSIPSAEYLAMWFAKTMQPAAAHPSLHSIGHAMDFTRPRETRRQRWARRAAEPLELLHNLIVHPLLGITRVLYLAAQWLHDLTIPGESDEPDMVRRRR